MAVNKKNVITLLVIALVVVFTAVYFIFINKTEPEHKPDLKETAEEIKISEIPDMPRTLSEAEEALKDPRVLLAVLNEYFIIEERPGLIAYSPEEFLEKKKGNAHDFAVFTAHIMWQNGIESGVLRFNYQADGQEGTHSMAVLRDQGGHKYLTVTDQGCQIFNRGSYEETVRLEAKRLKVTPIEYTFFPADFGIVDLSEPAPHREWIKLE